MKLLRVFGVSLLVTLVSLIAVLVGLGPAAAITMLILIVVEITFSFDNAIINARLLGRLSPLWQRLFLTLGVLIAVFGMRVIFPVAIVALSAHLSWANTITLALHHPHEYAQKLEHAHITIAAFGGAFLLMLALNFFFDNAREVLWLETIERKFQQLAHRWVPEAVTVAVLGLMALVPANHHKAATFGAGIVGIVVYGLIQLVSWGAEKLHGPAVASAVQQTGVAALVGFLYLEILDASFSFDGVIGAFAITSNVILIAVGLGVGSLWVRSLTVFMVKNNTLSRYRYLEHGAHYAILVLAILLLVSLVVAIPDLVAGVTGVALISASLIASKKELG